MAWVSITSADVERKLAADEFSAISEASLPDGVTAADIIAAEITQTVAEVRGYVAGNKSNILGEAGTIPDELMEAALVILRYKVFTRLPAMKALLDELRVREYDEALRRLRDVSAGRFVIVPPVVAAPDVQQPATPIIGVVSCDRRQNTRKKLGGLFG